MSIQSFVNRAVQLDWDYLFLSLSLSLTDWLLVVFSLAYFSIQYDYLNSTHVRYNSIRHKTKPLEMFHDIPPFPQISYPTDLIFIKESFLFLPLWISPHLIEYFELFVPNIDRSLAQKTYIRNKLLQKSDWIEFEREKNSGGMNNLKLFCFPFLLLSNALITEVINLKKQNVIRSVKCGTTWEEKKKKCGNFLYAPCNESMYTINFTKMNKKLKYNHQINKNAKLMILI